MIAHTVRLSVQETWEYSEADITKLILADIFGEDAKITDRVDVTFQHGQVFNGATVTHHYTESST